MSDLIIQQGTADTPLSLFIMGPTATGKTGLAMWVYDQLPAEIISVDSALVYRGMDIGTAKPETGELAHYPHHLIDIIDPAESYSAGQFCEDARQLMGQFLDTGKTPILAGGTMLYFNALQKGMANMPDVDSATREAIEREYAEYGLVAMVKRLQQVDPESAKRLHPNDTQRIKRALELYDFTGKTLGEYWSGQAHDQGVGKAFDPLPYGRIKIALMPPDDRKELRKRISQRFESMLDRGFLDEVQKLYNRGDLEPDMPSIRAVGYRQAWAYLAGEIGFDEMEEKAIIATAQLAKRQMTWLRKEQDCNFIDPFAKKPQKVLKNLKILLS
jgi:tRNA dimethylallyltransferase